MAARLTGEVQTLQSDQPSAADPKFKRLKLEFTRHFHPDNQPFDDTERQLRERVFKEFWPIVERIERS